MNPEEVLLAQALYNQERAPSLNTAITVGAGGGALAGMLAGYPVHQAGRAFNKMTGKTAAVLKPGPRMAGGLIGAALGGMLGAGVRQAYVDNNPSARILAKVQAGGALTEFERQQLENELAKAYGNQMGLRGLA